VLLFIVREDVAAYEPVAPILWDGKSIELVGLNLQAVIHGAKRVCVDTLRRVVHNRRVRQKNPETRSIAGTFVVFIHALSMAESLR
jgi:hypothetical protein